MPQPDAITLLEQLKTKIQNEQDEITEVLDKGLIDNDEYVRGRRRGLREAEQRLDAVAAEAFDAVEEDVEPTAAPTTDSQTAD